MIPEERLHQITQRFQYLEAAMAEGADGADIAALAKEYSDLRPVVDQIATYRQLAPVLAVVIILKSIFSLKTFDQIFMLTNGGPGTATQKIGRAHV